MADVHWQRTQIVATVITPLLLGVGGWYFTRTQQRISQQISQLEATTNTVGAMHPYFQMLSSPDTAPAKMAAYAIYMLKQDDPEMVVSLVLASNRPELMDVLKDLASKNPRVLAQLQKAVTTREGTKSDTVQTSTEAAAQNVIAQISVARSGWSYVGSFEGGRWVHGPYINAGPTLPLASRSYRFHREVYLRSDLPTRDYQMAEAVGVIKSGELVRIEEVRPEVVGHRVWARVSVQQ